MGYPLKKVNSQLEEGGGPSSNCNYVWPIKVIKPYWMSKAINVFVLNDLVPSISLSPNMFFWGRTTMILRKSWPSYELISSSTYVHVSCPKLNNGRVVLSGTIFLKPRRLTFGLIWSSLSAWLVGKKCITFLNWSKERWQF